MKSCSRRPTGSSAKAVTTAVSRPKQRFSPRATLYSPPPSQTSKVRVVANAAVAGIEAQHDFAQADQVPPAVLFCFDLERHGRSFVRCIVIHKLNARVCGLGARGLTPASPGCRPYGGFAFIFIAYPALTRWANLCRRSAALACWRRASLFVRCGSLFDGTLLDLRVKVFSTHLAVRDQV